MCIDKISIKSNIKNYDVFFENDANFLNILAKKENTVFIIDENVYKAHILGCLSILPKDRLIMLQVAEDMKNIDTVCRLYKEIIKFSPRKNLNLVSIGGGITQDVTGFVASSLYRGINWIFIPTTLLAQVDSCIGAKTSLNFEHYKNLIGTFYPPSEIYIYPKFLETLTKDDFYSGVGEMAKLHLMSGKADTDIFVNSLSALDKLEHVILLERIQKCLKIKKSYIENDEFDTGKRNMLNYGHCFGHAIESSTNFQVSHGQAVVLGMILANKEALRRGILNQDNEEFIREKVLIPVLKAKVPNVDVEKTVDAMRQDKKNLGKGLALVMINDNFDMIKITDMSEDEASGLLSGIQVGTKVKRI